MKIKYQNKYYQIIEKNGYEYIDYGRDHSGVIIIPFLTDANQVVLVKNFRVPLQKEFTELPRGFIDQGEELIQAALRECLEETGYLGDIDNCQVLGQMAPDGGLMNNTVPVVLINLTQRNKNNNELDPEINGLVLVAKDQVLNLLRSQPIVDGLNLAALSLWL